MPDLAGTLKEEIRRLARKDIKTELTATRKAVAQHRREIAMLKRELRSQEKKIASLQQQVKNRGNEQPNTSEESERPVRFSARSVKAQRERLGLSAADYAKLIGVSPFTIYNWENGKSRPRQEQLESLVAVRELTRREAAKKLEELETQE